MMFGNYTRLVYLAQTDDPSLRERAEAAAAFLGLEVRAAPHRLRRAAAVAAQFVECWTLHMPELTVISWRAIPAQVTAGKGRGRRARRSSPSAFRRRSTRPRCARA